MSLDRDTTITWYGHACVEVRTPGDKIVIFDPWFGNPSSPRSAESVQRCDVLLLSHGHGDHRPGRACTRCRSGSAGASPAATTP